MLWLAILAQASGGFAGVDTTISEFRIRSYGRTSNGVCVYDPDNMKAKPDSIWEVSGKSKYVLLVFRNPKPGRWEIVMADDSNRVWHMFVPEIIVPKGSRIGVADSLYVKACLISCPSRDSTEFNMNEVHLMTGKSHFSYLLGQETYTTYPTSEESVGIWTFAKRIPIDKKATEIEFTFSFYHVPTLTNITVTKRVKVK